jgi:hypothetical protein
LPQGQQGIHVNHSWHRNKETAKITNGINEQMEPLNFTWTALATQWVLICRREISESIIPGIFTALMIVFSMNNFIYLWTGIFDKDVTRLKILTGTYMRIHFHI